MEGLHNEKCLAGYPKCLCNTCEHDGSCSGYLSSPCCGEHISHCYITYCEDYKKETPTRGLRVQIEGIIDDACKI